MDASLPSRAPLFKLFAIKSGRHLQHGHVKPVLRELIIRYGRPRAIRSDNGSELLAAALQDELTKHDIVLANIDYKLMRCL